LPTCSEYAEQAIQAHGAVRGGWIALKRLLRCHPLGGFGFDPIPPQIEPALHPDQRPPVT
jgi:putative membrane protein insertion efficiency factor